MPAPTDVRGSRSRTLAGLLAVVGTALLFGVLSLLVRARWSPLESVDHGLAARLNAAVAPHPAVVAAVRSVTGLGGATVLWTVLALTALILLVRRRYRLVFYLLVAGVGALILDPTLKLAVGRLRPVVAIPVAHGGGNSFPSGHALDSIVCYGALLLVFLPGVPRRARGPVLWAVGGLVAAIGISRILLGVHYLTDVLGGWALGVAWLGLTAYAFELFRRHTGRPVTRPLTEGLEPEAGGELEATDTPVSRFDGWGRGFAGVVVAWVLVFGAVAGFGQLVLRFGGANLLGDHTVPHLLAAHRTPMLDAVSAVGGQVGNTHAITAVSLVVCALALGLIRRWRPIVFLIVLLVGEVTLFLAVQAVTGRPRPDVAHLDAQLPTSSFPSGHVAATVCLYVAVVLVAWPRTSRWWHVLVLAAAVVMPVFVALSRMYRGMHHPTDIGGGVLLAAAWLAATYWAVRPNADLEEQ